MGTALQTGMFGGYCYGPADVIRLRKGDSTMWVLLRDSAGKAAEAVYSGCVYWRLERGQTGIHISLVEKLTADQLLQRKYSVTLRALQKNTGDVEKLIREWEAAGLSFYLHIGRKATEEYLVVAENLQYREKS